MTHVYANLHVVVVIFVVVVVIVVTSAGAVLLPQPLILRKSQIICEIVLIRACCKGTVFKASSSRNLLEMRFSAALLRKRVPGREGEEVKLAKSALWRLFKVYRRYL